MKITKHAQCSTGEKTLTMEFIRAQRTRIPRITPADLSNYTVLITGSNTGLGLEAAREFLKSRPCRLILAVRNMEKGKVAKAELEKTTKGQTKIEVRKLDQGSFESVRYFVNDLRGERVDFALLNAGMVYLVVARRHPW